MPTRVKSPRLILIGMVLATENKYQSEMNLTTNNTNLLFVVYSRRGFNTPPLGAVLKVLNPRPIPFKNNIPRGLPRGI